MEQGGKQFDLGQDTVIMVRGRWAGRPKLGIRGFDGSRVFLEYSVRQRVRANPKVRLWQGADVTQILTDEACTRIAGVQIAWRRQAEEVGPEELMADLVVDASGRSSRTPQWLAQLCYDEPEETIVNAFLGYATRRYARPSHFNDNWRIMLVSATPPHNPRGGAILQEENGNWVVTLAGTARHYPPTDEAGFLDFAQKMFTLTLVDNVEVHKAFIEVQQLLQPPAHLFKPFVVMAVLGRLLRRTR